MDLVERKTEKWEVDSFFLRERGELEAWVGGGGKRGWVESGGEGVGVVAQERWRWRRRARRVDMSVSRM